MRGARVRERHYYGKCRIVRQLSESMQYPHGRDLVRLFRDRRPEMANVLSVNML